MKVLAVITNDKENSRSAAVAHRIIEGAEAAGHEVKTFALNQMPLLGCQNCRTCRKLDCDCILEDGLKEYFSLLPESDAVIVAAPNYNSQPSGSMITFLNRHYCLLNAEKKPRLDHDLRLVSVFAQGAPENYGKYEGNYDWFISCFASKRLLDAGRIVVGGDSDLSENGSIMTRAFELGQNL